MTWLTNFLSVNAEIRDCRIVGKNEFTAVNYSHLDPQLFCLTIIISSDFVPWKAEWHPEPSCLCYVGTTKASLESFSHMLSSSPGTSAGSPWSTWLSEQMFGTWGWGCLLQIRLRTTQIAIIIYLYQPQQGSNWHLFNRIIFAAVVRTKLRGVSRGNCL